MKFSIVKVRFATCAILVLLLTGCRTPSKVVSFVPWNPDKATWVEGTYLGVHFKAPKEFPRREYHASKTVAVCLSVMTGSMGTVPNDAVYIRLSSKVKSLEQYIDLPWEVPLYCEVVSSPVNGYQIWKPASWSPRDGFFKFHSQSKVSSVDWGYVFQLRSGRICAVLINKDCDKPFHEININEIVSAKEMELVGQIAQSIED